MQDTILYTVCSSLLPRQSEHDHSLQPKDTRMTSWKTLFLVFVNLITYPGELSWVWLFFLPPLATKFVSWNTMYTELGGWKSFVLFVCLCVCFVLFCFCFCFNSADGWPFRITGVIRQLFSFFLLRYVEVKLICDEKGKRDQPALKTLGEPDYNWVYVSLIHKVWNRVLNPEQGHINTIGIDRIMKLTDFPQTKESQFSTEQLSICKHVCPIVGFINIF